MKTRCSKQTCALARPGKSNSSQAEKSTGHSKLIPGYIQSSKLQTGLVLRFSQQAHFSLNRWMDI